MHRHPAWPRRAMREAGEVGRQSVGSGSAASLRVCALVIRGSWWWRSGECGVCGLCALRICKGVLLQIVEVTATRNLVLLATSCASNAPALPLSAPAGLLLFPRSPFFSFPSPISLSFRSLSFVSVISFRTQQQKLWVIHVS
jgi:hypothetical protein